MEEKLIEYNPYKVCKYFCIIFVIFAIWEVIQVVMFMFSGNKETAFDFLLFLGITVLIIINLNNFSKQKVIFTQETIYVRQNKDYDALSFYYRDFMYAYYCRDNNARLNLVLSSEPMELKKAKRIVNRISIPKQTISKKYIVLFIDERNKGSQIKKLIRQKIPNIYDE